MNLQEELKVAKERVAELERLAKEEQEFPQDNDEYWYIDDEGDAFNTFYDKHYTDGYHQEIGNIFKTKEQADFAVKKLKVEAELKKFSRPFRIGKDNIELYYGHETGEVLFISFKMCQMQGAIYFESDEKAQQAINAVGEERIKKYIFGVED